MKSIHELCKIVFEDYRVYLREASIPFQEVGEYLIHSPHSFTRNELTISLCSYQTPIFLKTIIPWLAEEKTSFKLIKHQLTQYQLNAGAFGMQGIGKILTIFPKDDQSMRAYLKRVEQLAAEQDLKGPQICEYFKIGMITYIPQDSRYKALFKSQGKTHITRYPRIINRRYIPIEMISESAKGLIVKAINVTHFKFDFCLIKQAKPFALDDHFGRTMKQRLLWQNELIRSFGGAISTPAVIDFYEKEKTAYLILEYIEGISLGQWIRQIIKGKSWTQIEAGDKIRLLEKFLEVLQIVEKLHGRQIIHRDITESNFIIDKRNKLYILDFELAYNMEMQLPWPPYVLGTPGYLSPEQTAYMIPTVKEDIYSLGSLIYFFTTGKIPTDNQTVIKSISQNLNQLPANKVLARTIVQCRNARATARPTIHEIHQAVQQLIKKISISNEG